MGTLYKNAILNNIVALGESCTPKVSPSKMCTELGLSRSLVTKLKENPDRTINGATAQKIADYFGVSVDCILGSSENKKSSTTEGVEPFEGYSTLTMEEREKVKDYIALLLAARQTQ
jgi:transcriptional regulator with XRE-family HTH domain